MPMVCSRRVVALCIVALSLTLAAALRPAFSQNADALSEATITVTGTATIDAPPDIAVISAGAVTEAPNARVALEANSAIMAEAFAALAALGVEDRDMQTSQLSVSPRYTYFEPRDGERRPPRIDGYSVTNQLRVRIRDLQTIGDALDVLIAAGVNQMGGLSFSIDEPEALFQEARARAVKNARAQADVMAEAAGISLGRVISIQQNRQQQPAFQPQMTRMAAADALAESVPIASGEQTLSATVHIVWALEQ